MVAVATAILLGFLGAGIGLWAVEPGGKTDSISGMATTTGIYLLVAQLIALFAGGYIASRMSAAWDQQNAILHGVVVWALATLAAIWMAATAIDDLVGQGGVISAEDRKELIEVMERRLGITKSEVEAMIDRWQQQAMAAYEEATQALESAKQEAIDAGDAATDALGTASFWSFIALLLGLAAAGGGAAVGRRPHPLEDTSAAHRTAVR